MTMRFGDRGPEVERLQGKLLRLGYELPRYGADGHLGDETWDALRQYAQDRRLGWAPRVPSVVADDLTLGATPIEVPRLRPSDDVDLSAVRFVHIEDQAPNPHPKSRTRGGKTVRRNPQAIHGITLHQMAVELKATQYFLNKAGGDPDLAWALRAQLGPRGGGGGVAAPVCVYDDLVACTTPLDWYMYAANRLNGSTVSIEVSGRFSGLLDNPNTAPREDLQTTWGTQPPMELTPARIRAGRAAIRYVVAQGRKEGMPIRYIYAHRQSNGKKPGDPGEGLWRALVVDYAVPALGLIPRHTFTVDAGRPIPREWDPKGVGSYR